MEEYIENIIQTISIKNPYRIITKKEIIIELEGKQEDLINIINSFLIKIRDYNKKITICCKNYSSYILLYDACYLQEEKLEEINFLHQMNEFFNDKLMNIYFQIKNDKYYNFDKEEDYNKGFLFGKLWNLDFLNLFEEKFKKNFKVEFNNIKSTIPLQLKGIKKTGLTRKFSYPNFINFIQIRNHLNENKEKWIEVVKKNNISLSKYIKNSFSDNKKIEHNNILIKSESKILKLDIQNFYGSIYSHAIDWSIRGKEIAKKDIGYKTFSGKIDKHVMAMNNNETFGLLVGTDLSRVIAEIFICNIEKELDEKYKNKLYRYVDDYVFFYSLEKEKDNFLKDLSNLLENYRLMINDRKVEELSKMDYLKDKHCKKLYKNIEINVENYLSEGNINKIASFIYDFIYEYISVDKSMYIVYSEIEKIFDQIYKFDITNETNYAEQLKKTKFVDLLMEIFFQSKGMDKYFLEFLYNNYNELDKKWGKVLNLEINKNYEINNIYTIQLLSLIFTFKLDITRENINILLEKGDSISCVIVYSYLNFNNQTNDYEQKINERVLSSIRTGAFAGEDFLFLTEFYLRNPQYKNSNCNISFDNIGNSHINNVFKKIIKEMGKNYLIDYEKIKST